jgi:serine/threonine-protein kinase
MKPGVVLASKYRLVSLLGEGGMGAVWRAEDVRLGSAPVAIKLLHERDANNPELRSRFDAEARIAARLRSPHVVQLYDVGIDDASGVPFLAMELLEGETLHERLSRTGAIAASEVARIVSHVARALSWAHSQGVVHRDLKPANIFLVQNADSALAKVLDFGVAKRTSQSLQQGRTATGMLLGTPLYMSPEQILSSRDVDHRADLWSLAVIAAECMTGQLPFNADNLPGLALQICHGQATPPSQLGVVPRGFDGWFERGTRANAEERFASAVEMADALRLICGGGEHARAASRADAPPSTRIESAPYAPAASVAPLSHTTAEPQATSWRKPAARSWIAGAAAATAVALVLLGWISFRREPMAASQPLATTARPLEPEQKAQPLVPVPQVTRPVAPAEPTPVIAPILAPPAEESQAAVVNTARTPAARPRQRTTLEPAARARLKAPAQPTQDVAPSNTPPAPASPAPDAFRTF